jgi:hypothetical protein
VILSGFRACRNANDLSGRLRVGSPASIRDFGPLEVSDRREPASSSRSETDGQTSKRAPPWARERDDPRTLPPDVWGDGFVPESHSTIQDNGGRYDQGRVFSAAIKSSGHPLVKKAARVAVDVRALTFLRVIPSMRSAFFFDL